MPELNISIEDVSNLTVKILVTYSKKIINKQIKYTNSLCYTLKSAYVRDYADRRCV